MQASVVIKSQPKAQQVKGRGELWILRDSGFCNFAWGQTGFVSLPPDSIPKVAQRAIHLGLPANLRKLRLGLHLVYVF